MIRNVLCFVVLISLIGILGCSVSSKTATTTTPPSVRPVREAQIASQWTMKQLEINLESEITLVLTLANGDKVDGYFYLEKGNSVGFQVSGNSLIYESKLPIEKGKSVTSDRFSFTASQSQGLAYKLALSTSNETDKQKTGTTVFLEVIYPVSGSLFVPYGTK